MTPGVFSSGDDAKAMTDGAVALSEALARARELRMSASSLPADLTGRIPELDGLRGVAIGLVLIQHYFIYHASVRPGSVFAYLQVPARLAWSGVDLFFVLSGFLIGGILLDAKSSANYFQVFYRRRFFRIVPIYAATLALAWGLNYLIKTGVAPRIAWMSREAISWWPYLFFLQNFWMSFLTAAGVFGIGVTWSLAVEEQFYLTLPLLVRFLSRRGLLAALAAGVMIAPALRVGLYVTHPHLYYSWFMLMPCRADSLLLGVTGALVMRDATCRAWLAGRQRLFSYIVLPVLLVGLAIFSLKAASAADFPMLSVGFTWLAVYYLVVLLYALLWRESWVSRCLRWAWLGWLGTIAYGTYLLHEFVLGLLHGIIWSRPPLTSSLSEFCVTVIALGVTLAICRLSWINFEKPLVKIGHRVNYRFVKQQGSVGLSTGIVEGN